jgi:hypothetical protein
MLRGAVCPDQADVEVEVAFGDRRTEIDGERHGFARALRMLDHRAQDGGRGKTAKGADKGPVVRARPSPPAAVARDHARGVIKQVLAFGEHGCLFNCHSGFDANAWPRNDWSIAAVVPISITPEVMAPPRQAQPVAPRWAPSVLCCVGRTGTFQISSAYSRMVRSEENQAMRATLRIEARVQAGITCHRASMPRWHS